MTARAAARRKAPLLPAARAAMLCTDPAFARYVATAHDYPGDTASFVRGWCDVASRRDLNTDPAAAARFETLRTEFDAWAGRIARPQ